MGEKEGIQNIDITNLLNIGFNTVVPGLMSNEIIAKSVAVPVLRLDKYIDEHIRKRISLIKIDVEGYEFPVLMGLSNYFMHCTDRPVIIIEIVPKAYPLLGHSLEELDKFIKEIGYRALSLQNSRIPVDVAKITKSIEVVLYPVNKIRNFGSNENRD